MPSVRQSQLVDTSRLSPERPAHITAPHAPMTILPSATSGMSSLMDSSLPVIASGTDIYVRQFYAGGRLPQRRFLPAGIA